MFKTSRFLKDESGVTAIEYGLIASGIGMAIILAVFNVGSTLQGIFTNVETKLQTGS